MTSQAKVADAPKPVEEHPSFGPLFRAAFACFTQHRYHKIVKKMSISPTPDVVFQSDYNRSNVWQQKGPSLFCDHPSGDEFILALRFEHGKILKDLTMQVRVKEKGKTYVLSRVAPASYVDEPLALAYLTLLTVLIPPDAELVVNRRDYHDTSAYKTFE